MKIRPVPHDEQEEVISLFTERDAAVAEKNHARFVATQLEELPGAGSLGYLSTDTLRTELLTTEYGTDAETTIVAFVRETYSAQGQEERIAYLFYSLARVVLTEDSYIWQIYKVTGASG